MNKTQRSTQMGPRLFKGPKDKERLNFFIQWSLGLDLRDLVDGYEAYLCHVAKHEGKLMAATRGKQLYDVALRYAAKLKFTPIPFMKSDKGNFPAPLSGFKKLLSGTPASKRAALTVVQLYKLIDSKGGFSSKSITDPYLGSTNPEWLPTFKQVLREEFPPEETDKRISKLIPGLHISGKNGPNGPAVLTASIDREAIRDTALEEHIRKLVELTGNVYLGIVFDETTERPDVQPSHPTRELTHSRIRVKYESGGKARLFCICDYLSQSSLLPIHNYLMDWLRRQPQDGTSNHSDAATAVKEWTDGRFGKRLWSFDLTTATDRYPRFLEKIVMEAIFGNEIADAWEKVISNRQFDLPDGTKVGFATGQPLGALSSWAAFAVTHHIHIRTASRLAGAKPIYRMIGDDIAIAGDVQTAKVYIGMMSDLFVPFSEKKSILPEQMEGDPAIELAKRLFVGGSEITPVPPDAILEGSTSPIGLKNLIEVCISRGYDRASQVYPVQSIMPSQAWFSTITFPIRNRLPQLNEVKLFRPFWKDVDEEPPAGLNRGWFTWSDFSDQELDYFLRELLRAEVMESYRSSKRLIGTFYEWSLIGPDFPVEGGDWQPEPWDINMTMLPRIVDYNLEKLEQILDDIRNSTTFGDVYQYIGGLHSYLGLDSTFSRSDFSDQKVKTRVFISKVVRKLTQVVRSPDPIETLAIICGEEV